MSDEPQTTLKRKRPTVDDPAPPQSNPNLDQERRELTDAEQLKKVMAQIEELSGGASVGTALPPPDATLPLASSPPPAAPFNLNLEKPENPRAAPEEVKQPPADPPVVAIAAPRAFKPYDVVQVYGKESRHYGVLLTVGDVKQGSLHGYILMEGGRREFLTVKVEEVVLIGESRVRLKIPCSGQWLAEHR